MEPAAARAVAATDAERILKIRGNVESVDRKVVLNERLVRGDWQKRDGTPAYKYIFTIHTSPANACPYRRPLRPVQPAAARDFTRPTCTRSFTVALHQSIIALASSHGTIMERAGAQTTDGQESTARSNDVTGFDDGQVGRSDSCITLKQYLRGDVDEPHEQETR